MGSCLITSHFLLRVVAVVSRLGLEHPGYVALTAAPAAHEIYLDDRSPRGIAQHVVLGIGGDERVGHQLHALGRHDVVLDRLDYAQRLVRKSDLMRETLELLVSWWRDLLLIRGGSPETVINSDSTASLEEDAHEYDLRDIVTFVRAIRRTQRQLDLNVDPRLALEVLMLDLPVRSN